MHIRNYLLIEELDLPLEKGLTIITGETGSGKSILIGALALAMGERAEAGAQRDPAKRCVIELEVDLNGLEIEDWFRSAEIAYERQAILRRQLEPGGRSRAFVNDTGAFGAVARARRTARACAQSAPHLVAQRPELPIGTCRSCGRSTKSGR
ncbi:MAG: AAA family ATPase [Flavobacteriales bacterium]